MANKRETVNEWAALTIGILRAVLPCYIVLLMTTGSAKATVRLPAIISDRMAIQQDVAVRIWGWADPDEQISIAVGEASLPNIHGDARGRWSASLPPQKAGRVPDITISGKNSITLKGIVAGEVWLCSGQSNMEWPVILSDNPEKEIAAANYPTIRLFAIPRTAKNAPAEDCPGRWVECTPENVKAFSGVAYFFGRELHQQLNVPVGLIQSAYGGSYAEAWTSAEALKSDPDFEPIFQRAAQYRHDYPQLLLKWESEYKQWVATTQHSAATQPAKKTQVPSKPIAPDEYCHMPGYLFNGMIAPLIPYSIRGAIWYQGENNIDRAYQYRKLLPALIGDWRSRWGQGDFPFGIVQLANANRLDEKPMNAARAELREAQAMVAAKVLNCGLAVTIDVGAIEGHPTNKQDVGRRLALWALATQYGRTVECSGPVYDGMKLNGDGTVRLTFTHASGLAPRDGKPLRGFTIAGDDRKFVRADAIIDGDAVIVHSAAIKKPVAVRYAWGDNPDCNLVNKAGLPAGPFRTDDWDGVTAKAN